MQFIGQELTRAVLHGRKPYQAASIQPLAFLGDSVTIAPGILPLLLQTTAPTHSSWWLQVIASLHAFHQMRPIGQLGRLLWGGKPFSILRHVPVSSSRSCCR